MAKATSRAPKNHLPPGVLRGSQPDDLLADHAGVRASRLLRGDFKAGVAAGDLGGISAMLLYRALRDGLVPAEPVITQVLATRETPLLMLASFVPLVAGSADRNRMMSRISARIGGYAVKDSDKDLLQALPVLWPEMQGDREKQAILAAVLKYLKRREKSSHRERGSALLTLFSKLEPAWYPNLVELALQIPSRPDLLAMLQEGDNPLVDHLLSHPELSQAVNPHDAVHRVVLRHQQDPQSALRILDALPSIAAYILTAYPSEIYSDDRHRTRSQEMAPLLYAWLDSRDPETIFRHMDAAELACKHPTMTEALCRAVLVKVCRKENSAYRALGSDLFFARLDSPARHKLVTATQAMRHLMISDCMEVPASMSALAGGFIKERLSFFAARHGDLPPEDPSRRILAIDLIASLLAIETAAPSAFPEVDRELAKSIDTPGDSLLELLLAEWAGPSAGEVKTLWRALAPGDAATATGLLDGLLARTPLPHAEQPRAEAAL